MTTNLGKYLNRADFGNQTDCLRKRPHLNTQKNNNIKTQIYCYWIKTDQKRKVS